MLAPSRASSIRYSKRPRRTGSLDCALRQRSASRLNGIANDAVIDIQISREVCIDNLGPNATKKCLDLLHDIQQVQPIHSIVWEVQEQQLGGAEDGMCLSSAISELSQIKRNLIAIPDLGAARNALGHDQHMYGIARGYMSSDCSPAPENLIVRMRRNHSHPRSLPFLVAFHGLAATKFHVASEGPDLGTTRSWRLCSIRSTSNPASLRSIIKWSPSLKWTIPVPRKMPLKECPSSCASRRRSLLPRLGDSSRTNRCQESSLQGRRREYTRVKRRTNCLR